MRVIETRIAHGRGIDQGRDLSKVFGAEPVKGADVRILELSEELDNITRLVSSIPGRKYRVKHSRCTSRGVMSWSPTVLKLAGSEPLHYMPEVITPS